MTLSKKEERNLRKYAFNKSGMLLRVDETADGKFCIRPIRWSAGFSKGKLVEGNFLALFDTKDEAIDAMVEFCGYSRKFALSLMLG